MNAEERNKRNQNWATLEVELDGIGEKIADSGDAKELAENVQAQVNALVVQGDSSVEARQARVDAKGVEAATLKARLDAEQNAVTQQLAETAKKSELEATGKRVDELIVGSGNANAEVTDAHVSVPKNKTFTTIGNRLSETETDIKKIENIKPVFGEVGKNLFDKTKVVLDRYIDHATGNVFVSNDKTLSYGESRVAPNQKYTRKYPQRLAFYDVNGTFISGVFNALTVTSPSNAYIARYDVLKTNLDSEQFELGSVSTAYESYRFVAGTSSLKNKSVTREKIGDDILSLVAGVNNYTSVPFFANGVLTKIEEKDGDTVKKRSTMLYNPDSTIKTLIETTSTETVTSSFFYKNGELLNISKTVTLGGL